jgi:hypothetical protein
LKYNNNGEERRLKRFGERHHRCDRLRDAHLCRRQYNSRVDTYTDDTGMGGRLHVV